MRKVLIAIAVIVAVAVTGVAFAHYTGQGGYGGHMTGRGYGGYGGHMMGHRHGGDWGGHMMGPGSGGYCWRDAPGTYQGKALTEKDVESIVRNYIGPNPNLKVGKIEEKGNNFEAEILTKDDSLVVRLSIDKNSGWVKQLY